MPIFEEFDIAARNIYRQAVDEERIIHNPGPERLRRISLEAPEVRESRYGNIVARTEPTARARAFTKTSRSPVTMLTAPAGMSEVSST